MSNWKRTMRYVSVVNPPTLLATFNEALAEESSRLAEKPGQLLKWHGVTERLSTVQAMLRHERPLWAHVFLVVVAITRLSQEEATARYWANAPSDKIAAYLKVMRRIDAMHEAQRRLPCRRILVDTTAPKLVATDRIYFSK